MPHDYAEWLEDILERIEISTEEYFEKAIEKRIIPFSKKFETITEWQTKTTSKTSAYQKRIIKYMMKHPQATLKEARGH